MMDAIDTWKVTKSTDKLFFNYKSCLNEIMCKERSLATLINDQCLDIIEFFTKLSKLLDDSCISHVQCSLWTRTDQSTLLTQQLKVHEFINELCNKLQQMQIFKPHSFKQMFFISEKRTFVKVKK